MIFGPSSEKKYRRADPFNLSRRQVVESLHSEYCLEVRTGERRKRKLRRSRWGLRLLKGTAVILSLISLGLSGRWAWQRAFYDNPDFRLKRVELAIPDGFSGTKVLQVAGIEQGMKMMAIDLEAIRGRLVGMPMVSRAEVSRVFPDKMVIELEEARPVAWLACPGKGIEPYSAGEGWLIDEQGGLVQCDAVTPRFATLPVIEVKDVLAPEVGMVVDSTEIDTALALMEASRVALEGHGLYVVEVAVKDSYSLRVRYNNRMEVVLGLADVDRALSDLRTILDRTRAEGRLLATVNLRVKRNIPVTFFEPPVARPVDLDAVEGAAEAVGAEGGAEDGATRGG